MKRFFIPMIMGGAILSAGCVKQPEPEFTMRNAQVELDLHSVVRGQSNTLLSLSQSLESHAKRDFSSLRKLDRDLEAVVIELDQLQLNLPSLLAAQDVELATLRELAREGAADQGAITRKQSEIQTYRKALIGSLDASLSRTALTQKALQATPHRTQSDLLGDVARDIKSARTTIAMQL